MLLWLSLLLHGQVICVKSRKDAPELFKSLVSGADGVSLWRPSGAGAALPWRKHGW